MSIARGAIVVMARAPVPGQVKTRMVPPLSFDEAAELYGVLLADVLDTTAAIAADLDLAATLVVHPPTACADMARATPRSFRVVPQRGGSLAERMTSALAAAAAEGISPVFLRGSDSPVLDTDCVRRARDALATADLVLCPDRDGGYNLVGTRRPVAGLFDHPMSTGRVLSDTLERARGAGLQAVTLEPGFDLDTVADLRHLAAARSPHVAGLCPRTLAHLDENDLWKHLETASHSR